MSDSLKDQLLGLGFKPAPQPERPKQAPARKGGPPPRGQDARGPAREGQRNDGQRRDGQRRDGRPSGGKPGANAPQANRPRRDGDRPRQGAGGKPRSQGDIDLAKAYAIRAQREKDERIAAEKAKQEEARLRREARVTLDAFVAGKSLNDPAADIARNFEYGGKIKRVYVTADQLKALNAGELGVLQQQGRYLLVTAAVLAEAEAIFAPAVALKVDPSAPAADDPYADAKFQVPDDLVW